jgi:HAD superfamily hydrolase (TIGR01509 family)
MIKAIIFDCFGVLVTEAWLPFKAKHFGHDPDLMAQVEEISWQANRGVISRDVAIQKTAALAGITVDEAVKSIDKNVPDEELFAYIRQLKEQYKIGLLSNIAGNFLHRIFSEKHLALFDVVSLSFEKGFAKPQAKAFEAVAEELGVELEECVLIDDQERNVTGAREAGMQAILYKDVDQLKKELSKLLA